MTTTATITNNTRSYARPMAGPLASASRRLWVDAVAIQFTWPNSPIAPAVQATVTTTRKPIGAAKLRRRRASNPGRTANRQKSIAAGASSANNWMAVTTIERRLNAHNHRARGSSSHLTRTTAHSVTPRALSS